MAIIIGQEFREQWYAQNISSKILTLGDLPRMPSFNPGDAYDLLLHHDKTDISKSLNLKEAILLGWMQVTKVVDSASMTYSGGSAVDSVTSAEVVDLDEDGQDISSGQIGKAKISSNDTTADYLGTKLVAGSNVTITEGNDGANETLSIAATIAGGVDLNSQTITASSYTAGTNDERVIYANAASNAITINLPAASGSEGNFFYIKKIDSTANAVTVNPSGSETLDGELTQIITTQYTSIEIHCNGTAWFIL